MSARFIGVRHRIKRTTEGESRPTQVAIIDGKSVVTHDLETEEAELDFVLGCFPTRWRVLEEGEDTLQFLPRHIRRPKKGKNVKEKRTFVPAEYEGMHRGDVVAMSLGGSGDRLAFAASRKLEEHGAGVVLRIPPFVLKAKRGEHSKDDDATLVAELAKSSPGVFYPVTLRDRDFIRMAECYRARMDAMKARMACGQRLLQTVIGQIFLAEGMYPEGKIEDEFKKAKASDIIYRALEEEEASRERELQVAIHELKAWQIFDGVEGCGEVIAAGIMVAIGDIRRFETKAKLKAFCGVHVLKDSRFARKRTGTVANWSPSARQALYLLGAQFNYRAESVWGLKLREYKVKFRTKHPEVVIVDGKKRYTDGHIHKMALWRTITKFVEWLHKEWSRLERARVREAA